MNSLNRMGNNYNITELLMCLKAYGINASIFARICDINDSQMRQYVLGIKRPSAKTIAKMNERIAIFADKLKQFKLADA